MRALFVAGGGGHLEELWRLEPRFTNIVGSRVWATYDSPQTRSLLAGEECIYVDRAEPRDIMTMLRNARQARKVLGVGEWSAVVSTGSVVAVPFLTIARIRGIPSYFIDSAARTDGPSLTGRILEWVPGVHRYCQYEGWARRRVWTGGGSVFDAFMPAAPDPTLDGATIRRVVVTLGASSYDFGRLIESLRSALPADAEVLWQTGHTDVSRFDIEATAFLPSAALADAMSAADLVVAHAGVGSALASLQAGHAPLLIPRRKQYGEHVDDHQMQIARHLMQRGIAVSCDANEINPEIVARAGALRVEAVTPPPFILKTQ